MMNVQKDCNELSSMRLVSVLGIICVHNSDKTFVNGILWVRICQDKSGYVRTTYLTTHDY